jgi:hypothetical protein
VAQGDTMNSQEGWIGGFQATGSVGDYCSLQLGRRLHGGNAGNAGTQMVFGPGMEPSPEGTQLLQVDN